LANEEHEHASFAKAVVNQRAELCVRASGVGPMQAGLFVVHGVIAVAEEQEVEQRALEVAGVVVGRPGVRVDVLAIVEQHDGPQRPNAGIPKEQAQTISPPRTPYQ